MPAPTFNQWCSGPRSGNNCKAAGHAPAQAVQRILPKHHLPHRHTPETPLHARAHLEYHLKCGVSGSAGHGQEDGTLLATREEGPPCRRGRRGQRQFLHSAPPGLALAGCQPAPLASLPRCSVAGLVCSGLPLPVHGTKDAISEQAVGVGCVGGGLPSSHT